MPELQGAQWIVHYILLTSFVWTLYLLWLIPFQLLYVKMTKEMFWKWLKVGTICEMIFTYPIALAILHVGPMITEWVSNL